MPVPYDMPRQFVGNRHACSVCYPLTIAASKEQPHNADDGTGMPVPYDTPRRFVGNRHACSACCPLTIAASKEQPQRCYWRAGQAPPLQ